MKLQTGYTIMAYQSRKTAGAAAGGAANTDSLLALKEVLLKAREETVKLQAERDSVSIARSSTYRLAILHP